MGNFIVDTVVLCTRQLDMSPAFCTISNEVGATSYSKIELCVLMWWCPDHNLILKNLGNLAVERVVVPNTWNKMLAVLF